MPNSVQIESWVSLEKRHFFQLCPIFFTEILHKYLKIICLNFGIWKIMICFVDYDLCDTEVGCNFFLGHPVLCTVIWPVYVTEPNWIFNNFWQTKRIWQKFIPSIENDYVVKSSQFQFFPYIDAVLRAISDNIKWTALVYKYSSMCPVFMKLSQIWASNHKPDSNSRMCQNI